MAGRGPTSGDVGATRPDEETWGEQPPGYGSFERTVTLGRGQRCWESATSAVLEWGVKARSGFAVRAASGGTTRVELGADYRLTARIGPLAVREPARVVAVLDRPARCGFAYGTLAGHPVPGEEAFVVSRSPTDEVRLTLRSLTRPAPGPWRIALPVLLLAQRWYRARYLRALRDPGRALAGRTVTSSGKSSLRAR